MKNYIFALALAMSASHSFGDVVIHLQTKQSPATTQPTVNVSAVSVSAVPGHDFATTFQIGQRTIEVNGTLETAANDQYRVKIKFTDQDQQGKTRCINTVVELKANDSIEVSKLQGVGSTVSTTLTVEPSKT